jgi:hypothetical protein
MQRKDFVHILAFERPHQHFAPVYSRHMKISLAGCRKKDFRSPLPSL